MTGNPIQDLFVRFGADVTSYTDGVADIIDQSDKAYLAMTKSTNATQDWTAAVDQAARVNLAEPMQQGAAAASDMAEQVRKANEYIDNFFEEYPAKTQQFIDANGRARDDLGKFLPMLPATADGFGAIGQAASQAGAALEQTAGGVFTMSGALKLLGIDLSARAMLSLAEDAVQTFAAIEKATIGITALTGSVGEAERVIGGLKDLALQDALSFPSLLTAEQRMLAFGFSSTQIPGALKAIADAAAATGRPFDAVANSFERVIETGNAQGRSLFQLGINAKDLAAAMGTTEDAARKAFQALDRQEQIDALEKAMSKFSGTAEKVASGLSGQLTNLGTRFHFLMEDAGLALAPVGEGLIQLGNLAIETADVTARAFGGFTTSAQHFAAAISETAGNAQNAFVQMTKEFAADHPDFEFLALGARHLSESIAAFSENADKASLKGQALNTVLGAFAAPLALLKNEFDAIANALDLINAKAPNTAALIAALHSNLSNLTHSSTTSGDAFQKAWAQSQQFTLGLNSVHDAQVKANVDLDVAKRVLDAYSASFRDHKAMTDGHVATLYEVQRAQAGYEQALAATNVRLQSETQAMKDWAAFVKEEIRTAPKFGDPQFGRFDPETIALVRDYNVAMKEVKTILDNAALAHANMSGVLDGESGSLRKTLLGWKEFMAGGWDLMTDKLNASMQKISEAVKLPSVTFKWDALTQGFDEIQNKAKGVTTGVQEMVAHFMEVNEKGIPPLDQYYEALSKLHIKLDEVAGTATPALIQQFGKIATDTRASLPVIEASWAAISGKVTQLAKSDLPAAIAAENQYIEALQRVGAPLGEIYEAQQKELELEIKMAEERGTDATAQMIQLQQVSDHMQVLKDHATALGDVYVQLDKILQGAFDKFGKAIADNIVDGKHWGEVFRSVIKTVEKEILESLIGYAFKALKDVILENTNLIGGLAGALTGALGKIIPSISVPGVSIANAAATAGPAYDPEGILQSVGGGAAGIAGDAGSLLSSLGSIASIAGVGVSIASGIVSGIQQAHANNLLAEIEESTRYTKIMMSLGVVPNLEKFLPLRISPDSINALADAMAERMSTAGSSGGVTAPAVLDKLSDAQFRRYKQRGLAPTRA